MLYRDDDDDTQAYYLLDEFILGGEQVESSRNAVVRSVTQEDEYDTRQAQEISSGGMSSSAVPTL